MSAEKSTDAATEQRDILFDCLLDLLILEHCARVSRAHAAALVLDLYPIVRKQPAGPAMAAHLQKMMEAKP